MFAVFSYDTVDTCDSCTDEQSTEVSLIMTLSLSLSLSTDDIEVSSEHIIVCIPEVVEVQKLKIFSIGICCLFYSSMLEKVCNLFISVFSDLYWHYRSNTIYWHALCSRVVNRLSLLLLLLHPFNGLFPRQPG